eukprot:3661032-Pyramimonas_sp.AAC.1
MVDALLGAGVRVAERLLVGPALLLYSSRCPEGPACPACPGCPECPPCPQIPACPGAPPLPDPQPDVLE